ncbi:MAG: phosphoglucosamine mutase [Armatimonadetes bacterium]|nr:phosphoglucosamine mutase [Armatimonadota bacterium]
MAQQYFGTDGIRGRAGEFPIDPAGGYRLGRAVATILACGARTFIGRDSRPSGVALQAAVIEGLRDGGAEVTDLGMVPTPAVAYFVAAHGGAAGVAISASHNPASENGFKLFGPGGEKLTERTEARIEAAFEQGGGPTAGRGGQVTRTDAAAEYVDFAVGTVPAGTDLRGLKVAVDCARGAASATTPLALQRLGMEVVTTCCDADGARINQACGSLHPDHVRDVARRCGASIGLAHDGDGDRLVLVDEQGEVVNGDRILGLSALALRDRGELTGGRVVGTIISNFGLESWLRDHGLTFLRADVGDRNVWKMMRHHEADLGGEPSGHTILRRLSRTDDALLTALHVLALMASSGRELHDLASHIPLLPQDGADLRVRSKPALESVPEVAAAMQQASQLLRDRGRMVVRYSGTEPVARILAEGWDPPLLNRAVGMVAQAFQLAGIAT